MVKIKPCCCFNLQKGTSILALVDVVLNALLLLPTLPDLIVAILINPNESTTPAITREQKIEIIFSSTIYIVGSIFQIFLGLYLWRAAQTTNPQACKRWLVISTLTVLLGISMIIIVFSNDENANFYGFASGLLGVIYKLFEMLVVGSFMREIKNSGKKRKSVDVADEEECENLPSTATL